jgi:hypothetical protein
LRQIGEGLRPRLVFGWAALREKLICQDLRVDDTTLELLKMAMRDVERPPVADETELRLTGGDVDTLEFQWIATLAEKPIAALSVPRDIYDGITEDSIPWKVARGKFERRLPGRSASADRGTASGGARRQGLNSYVLA